MGQQVVPAGRKLVHTHDKTVAGTPLPDENQARYSVGGS